MGTLKSTLKIESTDLFPTPVSFTVVNNNSVSGTYSGFNQITLASGSPVTLTTVTPGVTGAYVYAQAASTNTAGTFIELLEPTSTTVFATLYPGDVLLMPFGDGGGIIDLEANTVTAGSVLNFFVGNR